MAKQRVIDGNELLEIESLLNTDIIQKSKEASWLMSQVLHDIAAMPTIDLETMPIVQQLRAELKQVKAERDAALADLEYTACCETCAHGCNKPGKICCFCDNRECTCKTCAGGENWKWRGIVSENEEEKNDQS